MGEIIIGEGKYRLICTFLKPEIYRTEQRFYSPESRTEFRIMAERHGIQIEKEYEAND